MADYEFLSRLKFQFAKTMASMPHWYCVQMHNPEDYELLSEAIKAYGRWGNFRGRRVLYWFANDGFKYWEIFPVINRAGVTPAVRNKQTGQIRRSVNVQQAEEYVTKHGEPYEVVYIDNPPVKGNTNWE